MSMLDCWGGGGLMVGQLGSLPDIDPLLGAALPVGGGGGGADWLLSAEIGGQGCLRQ